MNKKIIKRILAVVIGLIAVVCISVSAFAISVSETVNYGGCKINCAFSQTASSLSASMSRASGSANYEYNIKVIYLLNGTSNTVTEWGSSGTNYASYYKPISGVRASEGIYYVGQTIVTGLYGT